MVLTALRGALGFLSQIPVGADEAAWTAFRQTPVAFPLAGYVLGAIVALPVVLPLGGSATAFAFLLAVVLVTGVNHADGLADLGDAAAVHGDPAERRAVMTDTTVGVGGVLALGVDLVGLALAGLALASLPLTVALGIVVASEVAAKLAMTTLVCGASASHEGFGATFLGASSSGDLLLPMAVALPVGFLGGGVGFVSLLVALGVAVALGRWATRRLDGVSGDVLGATNELARVVALHGGVIAWTHF